jgi:predicted P-loop ATPase
LVYLKLLIDFLNCLLKGEQTIVDIEYTDKEQVSDVREERDIIGELDLYTSQYGGIKFFKATITATTTNVRAAYARYAEQREHVASYCGTGNNEHFLGETVSRRWLPFYVEKIVSPLEHSFNHSGIFAQALYLYQSGFRYWFNNAEIKILARHNREFQAPCMEEELIPLYFRKPGPEECGQFCPTSYVLKYIADNIGGKLSAIKVGKAMKDLGFEQRKKKGQRGWICIPMTAEEMVAERKRLAMP